jgi:hypothetical protein
LAVTLLHQILKQQVMSKITDIIKNPGIIGKYINGVIHAKCKKEQVYQLAFVKEETLNMSMSVKPNNR